MGMLRVSARGRCLSPRACRAVPVSVHPVPARGSDPDQVDPAPGAV